MVLHRQEQQHAIGTRSNVGRTTLCFVTMTNLLWLLLAVITTTTTSGMVSAFAPLNIPSALPQQHQSRFTTTRLSETKVCCCICTTRFCGTSVRKISLRMARSTTEDSTECYSPRGGIFSFVELIISRCGCLPVPRVELTRSHLKINDSVFLITLLYIERLFHCTSLSPRLALSNLSLSLSFQL